MHAARPKDYAEARHATLFFEFPDYTQCVMHIVGRPTAFKFEVLDGYNPGSSNSLARRIFVAEIADSFTPRDIFDIAAWTIIKNSPDEIYWNCHEWVCDVLVRLEKNGALSAPQRVRAVDGMIYSCLEADDEGVGLLRKIGLIEGMAYSCLSVLEPAYTQEDPEIDCLESGKTHFQSDEDQSTSFC